jgi:hypothetical protein
VVRAFLTSPSAESLTIGGEVGQIFFCLSQVLFEQTCNFCCFRRRTLLSLDLSSFSVVSIVNYYLRVFVRMTNNGNLSSIPKSFSAGSLNKPLSSEQSLLSSTRNPVDEHPIYIDKDRRKAIIPTPNRPILRHNQSTMDTITDNSELTSSVDSKDNRIKPGAAAASLSVNDNPLIKAPSVTFNTDTHTISNVS